MKIKNFYLKVNAFFNIKSVLQNRRTNHQLPNFHIPAFDYTLKLNYIIFPSPELIPSSDHVN